MDRPRAVGDRVAGRLLLIPEIEDSRVRMAGLPVLLEPTAAQGGGHHLARAADQRRQIRRLVRGQWPGRPGVVAGDGRTIELLLEGDGWSGGAGTDQKGLWRRVIAQLIAQLTGKVHFDWRSEGLVCGITLPL
jgi:hypothetical protein